MKSTITYLTLLLSLTFSVVFISAEVKAEKIFKLRAASFLFKDDPANKTLEMFIERVNEKAGGKLTIEYLGGPEIVNEFDLANSVAMGVIDLGFVSSAFATGNVPGAEFYCTAQLSGDELRENGFYDMFEAMHRKGNLHFLGNADDIQDFWYIFLNKPVEKIDDLKGLRLGDGTVLLKFLKEVGASSVTIGAPDAYTALERGVIDGILWPRRLITALKLQETLKYYLDIPFFRNDITFVMNLEVWESFPPELKSMMEEIALSVEKDSGPLSVELEQKAADDLLAAGVKKIKLESKEAQKIRDMIYSTEWDTLVERYPDFGPDYVKLLKKVE